MHKYCLAGWQGEIAVAAATLAGMGYYSDPTFLDGERGFWRMYGATDDPKWGDLTDGLGEKWHIQGADYKLARALIVRGKNPSDFLEKKLYLKLSHTEEAKRKHFGPLPSGWQTLTLPDKSQRLIRV
jgi:hypothetical protein